MKLARLIPALLFALLVPALSVPAHGHDGDTRLNPSCCEKPARWAPRHEPQARRFEILTENGKASLLLTREVVAMQLSDRTMHKLDRELRAKERDEHDEPLANVIKGAVLSGVRALLDHSAECDLTDVRSVDYRKGRLVFIANDGSRLFQRFEMDDDDVLEGFSERDALAFIREFRQAKSRAR